jgi:molybdate transport system substrate-binding protein
MRLLWCGVLAVLISGTGVPADAAEIKLLSIPGIRAAFDQLAPQFERESGHGVAVRYEIYAGLKKEIESGDFDVAIFSKSAIEEMAKQGRVVAGSTVDIARTSIGVAVRKGDPKPDIGNEEAFKRTLLGAKSITYTKESSTGVYVAGLLDRLGLTEAIKGKLTLQPGGAMTTPAVARGEAELAIVLISDILATPGVDLVGPLPESIQNYVVQTVALATTAKQPAASNDLIKFLSAPAARAVFKSTGLDVPPR